ncbi:MAG: RNA polymerase sigma factor [Oscillochloridaceae bacterium umkhey_bin13]
MELSDEALINACRRGDEAAWDQLVTRYERLIFTIARRAGLEEAQAADVMQRVFMILLERLATISNPQRLAAWITATTRREAWRVRRQERMLLSADDLQTAWLTELEDQTLMPDELMIQLEDQHEILRALDRLDERCRTMLKLLFLQPDPPSYTEIAAVFEMPVGAIGPTRARCLEKLHKLFEDGRN